MKFAKNRVVNIVSCASLVWIAGCAVERSKGPESPTGAKCEADSLWQELHPTDG